MGNSTLDKSEENFNGLKSKGGNSKLIYRKKEHWTVE